MTEANTKVRIDKWLWAARFYKTRSMAAKAVAGGKVYLNNTRVKPSRSVTIGDEVVINRNEIVYTVNVRGLSGRRGPASVAQQLYEETEQSIAQRENKKEEKRLLRAAHSPPSKRPDKRERRQIRKFIKKD